MSDTNFTVNLKLLENYLFEIDFGEFGNIITDEPPPVGDGEGPGPAALLAASVANCLAASLLFAVRKYKDDPGEVTATVTGELGRVDRYLRITHLSVQLRLGNTGESIESLPRVLSQFENFCVVTQSVKQGIPVDVEVLDSNGEKVEA